MITRRSSYCESNSLVQAVSWSGVKLLFSPFLLLDTHVGGSGAVHASRLPLALAGFCRGPPAAPFSDRVWGCEAKPFQFSEKACPA